SYFPTGQDGVVYSPRNYDNDFRGPMLARHALAGSENVPAVALASRVGVPNLLRFLRGAGFSTFDKSASYYGLGVTLGDAEVRLDELVTAYAMFARGGVAVTPTMLRQDDSRAANAQRLVSARTAFWVNDILSDAEARAYAFGRGGSLEFPFAVAAKTGTSQAYRDNWTVGYTKEVTVGVWVGNFDRRPLIGSSGVTGAGPIFHAIMLAAARRSTDAASATIARPERTTKRTICALSGMIATRDCPAETEEWLADGSAPAACTWHRRTADGAVVDWPSEYRAWAATEHLIRVQGVQKVQEVHGVQKVQGVREVQKVLEVLRVVNPPDGAVYLIDPTL